MDVLNVTLDRYCKMLYFWKGNPTMLARLSNKELTSIIKFLNKYPEGLLNGYEKSVYLIAVAYILEWREDTPNRVLKILEDRMLQRAEAKAELLARVCYNAFKETNKNSTKKILVA